MSLSGVFISSYSSFFEDIMFGSLILFVLKTVDVVLLMVGKSVIFDFLLGSSKFEFFLDIDNE